MATVAVTVACRGSAAPGGTSANVLPNTPPEAVTPARVAEGDRLFNAGACVRCHGPAGVGGANGPNLTAGPWLHASSQFADIVRVITNGVPKEQVRDASRRFGMNPRGGPMNLTDDQVQAVAAYVWNISRKKG